MEPVMECFENWGIQHAGLFTFAQSAKHAGFYQRFGFWPRFLTAVMSKPIAPDVRARQWSTFGETAVDDREMVLSACRALTNSIYAGLDVSREISAVADQNLGDTVLLWEDSELLGLAICHIGPRTEAGSGTCYVKFGAARPGAAVEQTFGKLLDACEELAGSHKTARLVAGMNTARHEAYRQMQARGFHTDLQGVVMSQPNEDGYNRPGVYLIDDWR